MNLTIEINGDNAAFENNPKEFARLLRKIAKKIDTGEPFLNFVNAGMFYTPTKLRDINGNHCGYYKLTEG